ncbi:MAG: Mut7-C RNAse domain-containing protein [Anaerolineae bacterium]
MSTGVAFIADAMLGRLAKWLRLAGCDVLYDARMDDAELVRLARQSGRVLLTRDRPLAARRGLKVLLIESERVEEQLPQVLSAHPNACGAQPRCSRCNGELALVGRYDVEGDVPAYVWVTQERYQRCRGCGRVYWPGSHWRGIREALCGADAACAAAPTDGAI